MFVFDPTVDHHDPRAPGAAWTGGQWSMVRLLLGGWIALRLAALLLDPQQSFRDALGRGGPLLGFLPNLFDWLREPWMHAALAALAAVAALLLAIGWRARTMALLLAWLLPCARLRHPDLVLPSGPWIGLLLLVFATVPKEPYLSVAARGRLHPDGGWLLPKQTFQLFWLLLAAGCLAALIGQLRDPAWRDGSLLARRFALPSWLAASVAWLRVGAEAAIVAGAFHRRTRPRAWIAAAATGLLVALLGPANARNEALLLVLLFAFDPGWLPATPPLPRSHLFFDGTCGLCHRFVRMVLAEDRATHFWVAALQGHAIESLIDEPTRRALPDSIVVRTSGGAVLTRSSAVGAILDRLGGWWRVLATLLRAIPRPLRDLGYDAIASVRKKLFATPASSCPLLPPTLRSRFLE